MFICCVPPKPTQHPSSLPAEILTAETRFHVPSPVQRAKYAAGHNFIAPVSVFGARRITRRFSCKHSEDANRKFVDASSLPLAESTESVPLTVPAGVGLQSSESIEYQSHTTKIVVTAFMSSVACVMYLLANVAPGPSKSVAFGLSAVPFALVFVQIDWKRCYIMLVVSFLLLLLTSGFFNSFRMLLSSGVLGVALGFCLRHKLPVVATFPIGISAKMFGLWAQFQMFSFLLNYNVLAFLTQFLAKLIQKLSAKWSLPPLLLSSAGPTVMLVSIFVLASLAQTIFAYTALRSLLQRL